MKLIYNPIVETTTVIVGAHNFVHALFIVIDTDYSRTIHCNSADVWAAFYVKIIYKFIHGNRYGCYFQNGHRSFALLKCPLTKQFANILECESIAAFIMQAERNIYAFACGSLFLWMLFSYFYIICIWSSVLFICKKRHLKS